MVDTVNNKLLNFPCITALPAASKKIKKEPSLLLPFKLEQSSMHSEKSYYYYSTTTVDKARKPKWSGKLSKVTELLFLMAKTGNII